MAHASRRSMGKPMFLFWLFGSFFNFLLRARHACWPLTAPSSVFSFFGVISSLLFGLPDQTTKRIFRPFSPDPKIKSVQLIVIYILTC